MYSGFAAARGAGYPRISLTPDRQSFRLGTSMTMYLIEGGARTMKIITGKDLVDDLDMMRDAIKQETRVLDAIRLGLSELPDEPAE
jgi:hypothetical protein